MGQSGQACRVALVVLAGYLRHRAVVVDADVGGRGHGGVVATAVGIAEGAAVQLDVGLGQFGLDDAGGQCHGDVLIAAHPTIQGLVPDLLRGGHVIECVAGFAELSCLGVDVVAVAAAVEHADEEVLALGLLVGAHVAVVAVVDVLHGREGRGARCADGSGYVVAAIDAVDDDVMVLGADINKCVSFDVGLSGAAEDVAANVNLGCCRQWQQHCCEQC